jgi:DNA-binding LacI/PurR family transcriptional regulator
LPPPRPARITARDVARHAGVSQPTVSLVLSGNPRARVAPATRERVLQAVEALGYRPNLLARALVQRRSSSLGVIVPDLQNPSLLEVVSGIERVASEQGYAVLLCDAREVPAARHLELLRSRVVDGVILDAVAAAAIADEDLAGTRIVLIDEPSDRFPSVVSDSLGAGRAAAEHLLTLGHARLGFIGPAADVHAVRMRERGFVAELRESGVRIPSAWLRRAPASVSGGERAMRVLLQARDRPTPVFCGNDLLALGALKACASAGVRVPAEMSVMGCDDIEMARVVTPELSTVTVPSRELGARAARLLLQVVEGRPAAAPGRPLPVRLAARGTTTTPREA